MARVYDRPMPHSRLTLLRHAAALPAAPGGRDFDRPLSDAGIIEARAAARALAAAVPAPGLIVASPAARTLLTATLVRDQAFGGAQLVAEPLLYLATAETLLDFLGGLGAQHTGVLLVGHNPGLSDCCSRLAEDGQPVGLATADWRSYLPRGSFSFRPG